MLIGKNHHLAYQTQIYYHLHQKVPLFLQKLLILVFVFQQPAD